MTTKKSEVSPSLVSTGNIKVERTNPTDTMYVIIGYNTFAVRSHKRFFRFLNKNFDLSYQGASV